MKQMFAAVMACVGAVIGAGFASGREIVVFFTRYGRHAGWLIALSALVMTALCFVCMRAARSLGCTENWSALLNGRRLPYLCAMGLMAVTAGAMISAAGHVVELLWNHAWAYGLGVAATAAAAMALGYGSVRPLGAVSSVLSGLLLFALAGALNVDRQPGAQLWQPAQASAVFGAALRAIGYAGMNMMLAVGVVCRCAQRTQRPAVTAGWFGWVIGVFLLLSQAVYRLHPEAADVAFPIVALLSGYGRAGYLLGAAVLYLAILTTLISVLYALRTSSVVRALRPAARWIAVPGLPLAISGLGFARIVDRLYAPAGWLCLLFVFLPVAWREWKTAKSASFS